MKDHHKMKGFWILVLFTAISAFFVNLPLSPGYGEETRNTEVVFSVIGPSSSVLVDDHAELTSPEVYPLGTVVSLQPGTYYWKAKGLGLISSFTIVSAVALEVEKKEEQYVVRNKGNVPLDVETKQGMLTGSFVVNKGKKLTLALEKPTIIKGVERNEP